MKSLLKCDVTSYQFCCNCDGETLPVVYILDNPFKSLFFFLNKMSVLNYKQKACRRKRIQYHHTLIDWVLKATPHIAIVLLYVIITMHFVFLSFVTFLKQHSLVIHGN